MTRIYRSIPEALAHTRHVAHAPLTWDPIRHVLSRFAFGATEVDRLWIKAHGIPAWYKRQLTLASRHGGYGAQRSVAAQGPLLGRSPWDVRQWLKADGDEYGWQAMDQLTRVTLGLQVWSPAQLYETLVDLFANQLNVANHNGDVWNTRHAFDRDVIRGHVLGSYTDMLLASARHPAMLIYLNLADSSKHAINENYGRELLELHTVGLVYSEADVRNASYLLTGRTVDDYSNYTYSPDDHWTGAVRVLGFSHPNSAVTDGAGAGDAMIRYLAAHPNTAHRLATAMCVRFVSDRPSAPLVHAVARAYLAGHTRILPMVDTILRSDEFWGSRGLKVRRPTENLIATMRTLGTHPADWGHALESLHWMSSDLGNVPLDWATPDGYPDVAAKWRSSNTLLRSWEYQLGLADDWWGAFAKSNKQALYGHPRTSGEAITALATRLTGVSLSRPDHAAVQAFLGEPPGTPIARSQLRWRLTPTIALILHGPHHALR